MRITSPMPGTPFCVKSLHAQLTSPLQQLSTRGILSPGAGDIFDQHKGVDATAIYWLEARGAAKPLKA